MSLSLARTATQLTGEMRRARSTRSTRGARGARGDEPQARLVLGRYRLHHRLGVGAFGTVWQASDERLERKVAVKILPRERIVGGRFEREARAAARLAHPAIVTLYEAAVDDEGAYLVSELVRGSTLDELLEAGRLSDQDILSVGIALCDALEHAHAQGVVHRDMKPSNVLIPERPVTPTQIAKLTDFGIARVVGSDTLTRTGDVVGTLAYMAPEQAEGLAAGAGADLYSLALVLYEALTGVNPVRVGTAAQQARRLGAHLPPLRRQRRDLPRELGQGIDLALRPRPRERGRVLDLRRALVEAREHVTDEAGVVTGSWPRRTEDSRGPEPVHGHPWADEPDRRQKARPAGAEPSAAERWPTRGIAALGAAATAGWLATEVLGGTPVPPALAALIVGGLVLALPRIGWLALVVAACGLAIVQGHAGFALLTVLALTLPVIAMISTPSSWPLAAGAPALGLIGLAGAWPAVAARAATPWKRAALAGTGWCWLALATPIVGHTLYFRPAAGTAPPGVLAGSPYDTLHQMLLPLLTSGVLVPAAVWAGAAVVLPWLVQGRSPALDLLRVVIWSAVLVSTTVLAIGAVHGSDALGSPPTAVAGAVAGGLIALAPTWLAAARRGWRFGPDATGPGGQFP